MTVVCLKLQFFAVSYNVVDSKATNIKLPQFTARYNQFAGMPSAVARQRAFQEQYSSSKSNRSTTMLVSCYTDDLCSGVTKQVMTFTGNKTSVTIDNTASNLSGFNFLSVFSYYETLATKTKLFIAAAETADKTGLRWKASSSNLDKKDFVQSRNDLKRICANNERLVLQIISPNGDQPRVVKNILKAISCYSDTFKF